MLRQTLQKHARTCKYNEQHYAAALYHRYKMASAQGGVNMKTLIAVLGALGIFFVSMLLLSRAEYDAWEDGDWSEEEDE